MFISGVIFVVSCCIGGNRWLISSDLLEIPQISANGEPLTTRSSLERVVSFPRPLPFLLSITDFHAEQKTRTPASADKRPIDEHASIWCCQHLQLSASSVRPSRVWVEKCGYESRRWLFSASHGNPAIHQIMSMCSCIWPLQVNLLIKDYLYAGEANHNAWHSGKRGHWTGKDNVWSSCVFVKKM